MSGIWVNSGNRHAVRKLLNTYGARAEETRMLTVVELANRLREAVAAGTIPRELAEATCNGTGGPSQDEGDATTTTTTVAAAVREAAPASVPADALAALDVLRRTLGGGVDEAKVESMVRTVADRIVSEAVEAARIRPMVFEVRHPDGRATKVEGLQHKEFRRLMLAVSARQRSGEPLNVWLYGPAGTGKSTAARKLAEALGAKFETNGPVGSQWDIRGFTDATGKIVSTAFRRAWTEGGVYCWDEGDGSAPAALIEANGALATGYASFPDGVFKRHPDCVVIINGNLRPGAAPDATYNGRFKQDGAFVDRFVAIHWGIDEDLEEAMLGTLDETGRKWLRYVRRVRAKVAERGIRGAIVSPRRTQYGLALLDAGASWDEAVEMTLRWMFTDEQWEQIAA